MTASILQDLSQPEYVHVLINPLPIYGLAVATVGLLIAFIQRSRAAEIAMLILIILTALSAWPTAHYGAAGYDRVIAMADEPGVAWLKVHAHRVDQLIWFFYGLAAVAAAAILIPHRWPKAAPALAIVTLVFACIVIGMGGYIGYAGGKVRHREFRNELPPPTPAEEEP